MLSKMSIKRPLTIVLAMMLVVILAVVSFTRMPTDLFPEMCIRDRLSRSE